MAALINRVAVMPPLSLAVTMGFDARVPSGQFLDTWNDEPARHSPSDGVTPSTSAVALSRAAPGAGWNASKSTANNVVDMLRALVSESRSQRAELSRVASALPGAARAAVANSEPSELRALIDAEPIRRVDPLQDKLHRRAVQAVLQGTPWLSAREVGERASPDAANKHAYASRLLKERRVFAIERSGVKEFPAYAFDPLGNPYPAVREILAVLADYEPYRLASWFESPSSTLGGKRPRELLATKPAVVLEAAKAQVSGPTHG